MLGQEIPAQEVLPGMVLRPPRAGPGNPGLSGPLAGEGRRAHALLPSISMTVADTDDYAGDQPQGPGPEDEARIKRPTRRRPRRPARQ